MRSLLAFYKLCLQRQGYFLIFPNSLDKSFGGLLISLYFCKHETNEERSLEDAAQPIGK